MKNDEIITDRFVVILEDSGPMDVTVYTYTVLDTRNGAVVIHFMTSPWDALKAASALNEYMRGRASD